MFGTDEAFCRCTEGHAGAVAGYGRHGHGQFHIRVDDQSTLYVNGQNVGETTAGQWNEELTFAFTADCRSVTPQRSCGGISSRGGKKYTHSSCTAA